jgi:WD40 repeat protein
VKAIAISPDGQILISGSADKTIKIWHLDTGDVLYTLTGHSDEVKSVVVSPVSVSPSKMVGDRHNSNPYGEAMAQVQEFGQILVSASADKTIKIWRLDTGELLQTLNGHSAAVNSVAITPDGEFIVSGSSDKTIKIWQIFKGKV